MRANSNSGGTASLVSDLSGLLTGNVERQPDRTSVGTSDLRTLLTYSELDTLVRSVTGQLSRLGLKRGNTVALISDNCVEFVLGLWSCLSSGARVAPLNPGLNRTELRARLTQLSASAVLVPRHLEDKIAGATGTTPFWVMDLAGSGSSCEVRIVDTNGGAPAGGAALEPAVQAEPDDIALLLFTGGTTGPPKLVPLTHRNVSASIGNICCCYALSPADATLLVMPLFHGHGLIAGLLSTLASGGAAYLPSTGSFSAHLFWPDVVRLGVTWYTAAPTIHTILLNRAAKEYPRGSPPALRFIRSCSAPLDENTAATTAATFGVPVITAYGMTEASHQVASNPLPGHGASKLSSVGLATGTEMRVVGENGRDAVPGDVGEIWVWGATVTPGYLNNAEANAASFVDGWFRSGDWGCRDADGYIFIKGRLKEMINRGGEKIAPSDIDATLLSNPKVLEAAAFAEADAIYGEIVQAAVILRLKVSATEEELREYCRARLSSFEVPDRIHIVADLPRTAKGSIDRQALAARFARPKETPARSER
jgi:oxalate---CoA ligase